MYNDYLNVVDIGKVSVVIAINNLSACKTKMFDHIQLVRWCDDVVFICFILTWYLFS